MKMLSMVCIQLMLSSFLLTLSYLAVIPNAWIQEEKMSQYEPCMHSYLRGIDSLILISKPVLYDRSSKSKSIIVGYN